MSYAGYGQSPYVQEPKVRFDAIGEAWGLVRAKMSVWVVAALIYIGVMLLAYAIVIGILFALGLATAPSPNNPDFLGVPGQLILNVAALVVGAFFQAGMMRMALKQVRGQDIQVSDLFSAGDVVGPAIGTQLVYGIATYIGTILCIIPGFMVMGRGMFAMPLTVDRNENGFGALQKSWEALKNDTLNAILFILAASFVSGLGAIACGIGAIVTAPIYPLAIAIVYRDFFDRDGEVRGPTLNMPLPPASAYGAGQPAPGRFGDVPPVPYGQTPGDVPRPAPGTTPPPPGQNPPPPPGQMGSIQM